MNLPNKLTVLRVCLIPVFLFFLLASPMGEPISRYVALGIFIIASSTDALDGYIARKYNLITNFGKFMDPLADKLLVCSAMIAMIEMGDIPSLAVIVIIAREFIITGFRLVASDEGIVIAASMWGKIKTITQMIMVIYLLLGLKGDLALSIGNILIMASVFFTVLSAVDYIYKNKAVLK
jgi:CDP-diacylglycerol--glycerol-3-phosphate 3-phosphatidyltransferase